MAGMKLRVFLGLGALMLWAVAARAQDDFGLVDVKNDPLRQPCEAMIRSMPKEVKFDMQIRNDSVYFGMTNETWFHKIFPDNNYGVTADVVVKEQFDCNAIPPDNNHWYEGTLLRPVYLADLQKRLRHGLNGHIEMNLGPVPEAMRGRQTEANMVILRNKHVCRYTWFMHVDATLWDLLDMGLYTDSLVQAEKLTNMRDTTVKKLYFAQKRTVVIPYQRNESAYTAADKKRLYDAMQLKGYRVQRIEVRAYASVEGPLDINLNLQKDRAARIVKVVQEHQKQAIATEVRTAENWVEFMQAIERSPFAWMLKLSKQDIKKQLERKSLLDSLEPRLARTRKTVVIVYLSPQSEIDAINDIRILDTINAAIKNKDVDKSVRLLRALFMKVADNQVPASYMDKVNTPDEKEFSRLLNDYQVYKYMLGLQGEYDALTALKDLEKKEPQNGKIKYNICALQLRVWENDANFMNKDAFLKQILALATYKIPDPLIKRMLINYHIIMSEIYMHRQDYAAKDRELAEIKLKFVNKALTDEDLLSLAKYFVFYSRYDYAADVLKPRIAKIDVNEDLLFYYLNVLIVQSTKFDNGFYRNVLLNAQSINPMRFCRYFDPVGKRGAISMQLLREGFWHRTYCESCGK